MDIIQSWKESLRLLQPQNLKPFVMVTIKTVLDLYKNINKPLTTRGNWILFGALGVLIVLTNTLKLLHLYWLEPHFSNAIRYTLVFVFALALRPSINQKSWDYFHYKLQQFWPILIGVVLVGMIGVLAIPFVYIWTLFFLFAAFDTHGTVSEFMWAVRTSIIMLLYNFPLCACAYVVLTTINIVLYYLIRFVLGYFGGLTLAVFLYIVFVPMEIALIANLYIKFIHGQPSLYFKQPE